MHTMIQCSRGSNECCELPSGPRTRQGLGGLREMSFIASSQPRPYFIFTFRWISKMIIWFFFKFLQFWEFLEKWHAFINIQIWTLMNYLNELLDKLSKEKNIFFLGEFSIIISIYQLMSSLSHFHHTTFFPISRNPLG